MATVIEHIERLREKPHHVRHRIALFTSAGITGLVALFWIVALSTSATLAPKPIVAEEPLPPEANVGSAVAKTKSAFTDLLGAAGAAVGATSSEAALTIIQTRASSTIDTRAGNNTSRTVIPF